MVAEARREMRAVVEQLQRQAAAQARPSDAAIDPTQASMRIQEIAELFSPDRQEVGTEACPAARALRTGS